MVAVDRLVEAQRVPEVSHRMPMAVPDRTCGGDGGGGGGDSGGKDGGGVGGGGVGAEDKGSEAMVQPSAKHSARL